MKDNLSAIKTTAILFLQQPITHSDIPGFIFHPIFDYATFYIPDPDTKQIKMLNLTNNQELAEARKIVNSKIQKCTDLLQITMIIRKAYQLTFLKYIEPYLTITSFSQTLAQAYMRSENPNRDINVSIDDLKKWFCKADKTVLMSKNEYKKYCELPDILTVYRGIHKDGIKNGLSWTTSREQAIWFANRFSERTEYALILTAEINKCEVYACFDGRNEQEVICQPKNYTIEKIKNTKSCQ